LIIEISVLIYIYARPKRSSAFGGKGTHGDSENERWNMDTLAFERNVYLVLDRNIDYYSMGEEEKRIVLSQMMNQMR
jgi:hypothetical protein